MVPGWCSVVQYRRGGRCTSYKHGAVTRQSGNSEKDLDLLIATSTGYKSIGMDCTMIILGERGL